MRDKTWQESIYLAIDKKDKTFMTNNEAIDNDIESFFNKDLQFEITQKLAEKT